MVVAWYGWCDGSGSGSCCGGSGNGDSPRGELLGRYGRVGIAIGAKSSLVARGGG